MIMELKERKEYTIETDQDIQLYYVQYNFDRFTCYFTAKQEIHSLHESGLETIIEGGVRYSGAWTEWIHFGKEIELYFAELQSLYELSKKIEKYCKTIISKHCTISDPQDLDF